MKSKEILSSLLAAQKFRQASDILSKVKSEPLSGISITPIQVKFTFVSYFVCVTELFVCFYRMGMVLPIFVNKNKRRISATKT